MRQLIFLLLIGILIAGTLSVVEGVSEESISSMGISDAITPENAGDIATPCGGGSSDGGGGAPG